MQKPIGIFATLLFLVSVLPALWGQTVESYRGEPAWLLLERGRIAFENREYGEALRIFREVREYHSSLPEADIEIGRVFEAEGELDLALRQYRQAYAKRALLEVSDDAVDLLYRIAAIEAQQDAWLQHEATLHTIIERMDSTYEQPPSILEQPLVRVLTDDGLDKVLELYRLEDHGSQYAYHLLARFLLYEGKRPLEAIRASAISVVMTITEAITYAVYIDPEFRFTTIEQLLEKIGRFASVSEYLSERALFDQLYVLGHAFHEANRVRAAEEIRQLLVRIDPGGQVGIRASMGGGFPDL